MGHFYILLLQTPQDLLESYLEAGVHDCSAGPSMLPGAPRRPLHLPLVDALDKCLHHGLQLIEGGGPALPHMIQGHGGGFCRECRPGEVKRSARSTWKRAWACRGVTGASFEGTLEKILRGLEQQNIKMSHKIGSRNDPENQFKRNNGLIVHILLLTFFLKDPVVHPNIELLRS